MAHKHAPGTSTRGGVITTMDNTMKASSSPGDGNNMKAPFDKPHATGGGGIPTIIFAKGITAPAVPKPGQGGGTVPTVGGQGGQKRPGTK